jgi:hypothetical protein
MLHSEEMNHYYQVDPLKDNQNIDYSKYIDRRKMKFWRTLITFDGYENVEGGGADGWRYTDGDESGLTVRFDGSAKKKSPVIESKIKI